MAQPTFFKQLPPSMLADLAASTGANPVDSSRASQIVTGLAALDEAGPMHRSFFENYKSAAQLATTRAGACLVSKLEIGDDAQIAVMSAAHDDVASGENGGN